jgi:hypothetical protein
LPDGALIEMLLIKLVIMMVLVMEILPLFQAKSGKPLFSMVQLNNSSNIVMKAFLMGLLAVAFIGLSAASPCWSKNQGSYVTVFPLEVKDKPLREVLNQLGQAAGYSIEISTNCENTRITVPPNIVKFEEGLKVILKSAGIKNYAIIDNETKMKLTIYVAASSASSGIQNSPVKAIKEKEDQIEGSTFFQDEMLAAPPEHMVAKDQTGGMPVQDNEPVPPPPEKMLKGGEQEEPASNDGKPISPPSEDVINQHHGGAAASSKGPVAPPPEEVIR